MKLLLEFSTKTVYIVVLAHQTASTVSRNLRTKTGRCCCESTDQEMLLLLFLYCLDAHGSNKVETPSVDLS